MSYFGDGTGRDSYVIADYGGLVRKYQHKGFIQDFTNSLRKPRRDIRNQNLDKKIIKERKKAIDT